ncbi:MAG TPA: glycoside hydrolase family 3 N-terminal domain-containing protein [Ktedonobacterales bacterium]|jgi:beta-N-acetylhexosaminidase|nr:glycoside hydrolase family 3 N-terminal domain-containing protein [Ktedonobacterales bacterium]
MRLARLPRSRSLPATVVLVAALISLLAGCSLPFGDASNTPSLPTATATPRPPTPEEIAAQMVSKMSLEDKLGQMIIMQFYEPTYTPAQQQMVKPFHPGGVILYGYSMGTAQQVKDLLAGGQKDSPIPMFTFLDLEGGLVDRLAQYLGPRMSAPKMAASGDPAIARAEGAKTAKDLLSFGFNADLAPDVDISIVCSTDQWGRTFGKTPDAVTQYASAWIDGLQSSGVVGVPKHFPGLGAAVIDAHKGLPVINRTKEQLEETEFAPFKALIASGQMQMVMSTDVLMPALDVDLPAEISKPIITGVLRNELGFKGVAITDALYMQGITDRFSFTQAAIMAFEAGNDMIMAPWRPNMIQAIITGMKVELQNGKITQQQIDASVTRILALKIRYNLISGITGGATPTITPSTTKTPATTPTTGSAVWCG